MQADFTRALMNPELPCPPGLYAWNGSEPAQRFAVYRNNVMVSLLDALASTFPVALALVGEDFFREMARSFLRNQITRPRVLTWLGQPFPDYIAHYEAAASVPYLADVARLEMARVCSTNAADHEPMPETHWAALMAQAEALAEARMPLAPCVQLLQSPCAMVSVWAAHQVPDSEELSLHDITLDQPESALVFRQAGGVRVLALDCASYEFFLTLQQGHALAQAVQLAQAVANPFDLATALTVLIRHGLVPTQS